jgi:hypothetical protein
MLTLEFINILYKEGTGTIEIEIAKLLTWKPI